MKTCPFISHLLGDEQSEIATLESAENARQQTDGLRIDAAGNESTIAPHLLCLRESCRFYEQTEQSCAFDTIRVHLEEMQNHLQTRSSRNEALTQRVTSELNKFWKFQAKSVAEIVSQMSEVERQQRNDMDAFKHDLEQVKQSLETGGIDAEDIEKMHSGMEELRALFETGGKESTGSPDALSDFANQVAASLQEMHTKTDSLCETVEHLEQSLPGGVDQAISELRNQQHALEDRLDALVDGQHELLSFFKADKNRREVEWLRSNKKEARAFNNLGVSSYHSGAFDTAKEQFLKAIELDPEFAEVYNNLGLVYTELGNEEHASEAFKKATELKPDMTAAYSNLGFLFHKQGSYEQAVEMYNEALGRSSKSSPAYTNLGNAYFKLGRSAEAEEAWEKALEIDPSNEQAALYLKQLRAEKL